MTLATVSISSNTSIIGIALGVMLSLCVPTASAQRDQLIEKNVKASKTTFEDAMSMCNGDTRVLQELTGSGSTPLTRKFKVTSWNGECLNGKRHGKGTIDVQRKPRIPLSLDLFLV